MKKRKIITLLLSSFLLTCFCFLSQTFSAQNEKIFILTGEPSGDALGAWYLNKLKEKNPEIECFAIGNNHLEKAGAKLYKNFDDLTLGVVGITKLISHIPTLYKTYKKITEYILENNFSQIILVDCPLLNIPIARKLKKETDHQIKITYIAPPEMWIWGKWGLDRLFKKYCDKIIVIYPFEVEWYKQNGLKVEFLGYPFYKKLSKYFDKTQNKQKQIAIFLGSRQSELQTLLPIFTKVIKELILQYSELKFILPLPISFQKNEIEKIKNEFIKSKISMDKIYIIQEETKKYKALAKCCLAITKPGTNTLELALLQVPSIITYKIPWLTYLLAKLTFRVPFVGLPNLLLNQEVCKELIQSECTPENIFKHTQKLYQAFLNNEKSYQEKQKNLTTIRTLLAG